MRERPKSKWKYIYDTPDSKHGAQLSLSLSNFLFFCLLKNNLFIVMRHGKQHRYDDGFLEDLRTMQIASICIKKS